MPSATPPTEQQPPPAKRPTRPVSYPRTETLQEFQQSDFYRTLVENNLFEPLGSLPVKKQSRMQHIATVTVDSASAGGTAWIQTGTGDIITVKVGDELDGAKVVDIQNKQMTLETAGQQTTLKLQQHLWLSPEQ